MKVSGFTFVRNGTILGYPYIESILSLLSVCDEVIVAVGNSDDDTLARVLSINDSKLRVLETTWNDSMSDRGYTYAQQKMLAQFNCTGDWAFYLECDEIIHEDDVPLIRAQMAKYLPNKDVEALVFDYYHFYGTPENLAISPRWYKRAPRIIRNTIRSWAPDGLFWIVMDSNKHGRYPNAALVNCPIYHYGHVRLISAMNEKNKRVERYWGKTPKEFYGYGNVDVNGLAAFQGSHPKIVTNWLESSAEKHMVINKNYIPSGRDKRHRIMMMISRILGNLDWTKKHYKLVRE
ncbi:MAG: glycosyltransferase family 2 protein [Proteobacteria bacterium]|jgi:glycosyltransferase involved in cell wall biosynthesis|nr:glycosyltransferase family 2 protein [Pseudomonadota bacterium]